MGRKLKQLGENEDDSDTSDIVIAVRAPKYLVKRVDNIAIERKTNRSIEVKRALEFLVSAIECPNCKTLNSWDSKVCSRCGSALEGYAKQFYVLMKDYEKFLSSLKSLTEKQNYLNNIYEKLNWLIGREKESIQLEIKRMISPILAEYINYSDTLQKDIQFYNQSISDGEKYTRDNLSLYYPIDKIDKHIFSIQITTSLYILYKSSEKTDFIPGTEEINYLDLQKIYLDFRDELSRLNSKSSLLVVSSQLLDTIDKLLNHQLPILRERYRD